MNTGWKKVGHKSRRGRKHKPKAHSGHRKAQASAPGSEQRQLRARRKRRLQELRAPEIDY